MARRHIVLIGFSGSGKSTVGPLLATRLKRVFVDIDQLIQTRSGMSITEMFASTGEKKFRQLERQAVVTALKRRQATVIALGGGAFESREVRRAVREAGLAVYLSCSHREIYRRLKNKSDRPLLNISPDPGLTLRETRLARIGSLLKKRLANYRSADLVVTTTNSTPARVVRRIIKHLDC